jgi:predicted transcriptional regulator
MTAISAKPMSVKLDQETRDRIEHLAESRRRTTHWMMREAIHQYIEREEKREAFRRDGINAWNEYQATGLHVTSEEADAWLAKLESGQDAEPPECHV